MYFIKEMKQIHCVAHAYTANSVRMAEFSSKLKHPIFGLVLIQYTLVFYQIHFGL